MSDATLTELGHSQTYAAIGEFVGCVYEPADIVEVRLLRPSKVEGKDEATSTWYEANALKHQVRRLLQSNKSGWNIYVGANPRATRGGAKAKDVALARCLVADFDPGNFGLPDGEHVALEAARERWHNAGLPEPTLILDSGHGFQSWWWLTDPIADLVEWTRLQKALIRAVGSDDGIHDSPRIMRLPGFNNAKFKPHVPAKIVAAEPKQRYPLDQMRAVLDPYLDAPAEVGTAAPAVCNGQPAHGLDVLGRATAYAAKVPAAQAGERNKAAFVVAAVLVKDFDLHDSDAWPILDRWNTANRPPLPDSELRGVLASARRNGKHTPGAKLVEAKDGMSSTKANRRPRTLDPYKPFPVEVLPEPVRSFVVEASCAIGCDASYVALPLLAALAATIGNKRRIELKRGWCEPSVLWCAIVGESGTLKSPALDKGLAPLRRRQTRALQEYREAVKRYEREVLTYGADYAEWKKSGRKNDEPPPEPPVEPKAERFIVSDITVEALIERLQDNPNGLLLERDELAGWIGSFNQYKGGRGGDVPQYLSMHRAGPVLNDRKTGHRILYAERGAVSVCGGIQPEILRQAMAREHFEDGLGARLLLAMPPTKAKRWTEAEVDEQTEAAIEMIFERLFALVSATDDAGNDIPFDLRLSATAKPVWIQWYNRHAHEQAELSGDLAAAWSKLEGYGARLALVIHRVRVAADDPTIESPDRIDAASIRAGCALSDWFASEARHVYGVLGESDEDREQRRVVELIQRKGGRITANVLRQSDRRFRDNTDEAQAALERLVKDGLGRWQPAAGDGKGGRPTREFHVSTLSTVNETPENPDESGSDESGSFVDIDKVDESKIGDREWTF